MKIVKQILTGLVLVASATTASAVIINDGYTGSNFAGDILGNDANYQIHNMNVQMVGVNMLSVSINTNFSGKTATLLKSNTLNNTGILYGDLFLSSSWNPVGPAPYLNDDNSNGTVWEYGFSLGNRTVNNDTTGTLYSLNAGNNNANALLSDDFMTAGSYRHGQEVAVDTQSDVTAIAGNSSWSVTAGKVNFLIDLTGTALENSNTIALHWGMSCANDVIEGQFSVPEPAILGLLALGLIGIGATARRRA